MTSSQDIPTLQRAPLLAATAPMPTASTTDGNGSRTYAFSLAGNRRHVVEIPSSKTGTWHYRLAIVKPSDSSYTYDISSYRISIRFFNDKGTLRHEVSAKSLEPSGDYKALEAHFRISRLPQEKALPAKGDPSVTKVVESTGVNGNGKTVEPAHASAFAFTLEPCTAVDRRDSSYPMPAGSSGGRKTIEVTGARHKEFGSMEFPRTGTYRYRVTERRGSAAGYTHDATVYKIEYVVSESGGKLTATRRIYRMEDGRDVPLRDGDDVTFTNRYAAPGSAPGHESPEPDPVGTASARPAKMGDMMELGVPFALLIGASCALFAVAAIRRKRSEDTR